MNMRLEAVIVPVSDIDRAKNFYEKLGFRLDIDYKGDEDFRIVHFTPPGSASSILFGKGITESNPGSIHDLVLVVDDIEAAHEDLRNRGIDAGEIYHDAGGVFRHTDSKYRVSGTDPNRTSYGSFISFQDPDGNGWLVQEVTERLPGR